jgi:hypothetical protein
MGETFLWRGKQPDFDFVVTSCIEYNVTLGLLGPAGPKLALIRLCRVGAI